MTRIVVVGAGITGAAAAYELSRHDVTVDIVEANDRVGGLIRSSPFAGLPAVDEGADAFLLRTPSAARLAEAVGLGTPGAGLVSPTSASAAIWMNGLRRLPAGLLLGVPTQPLSMARNGLFGVRGTIRAAGDVVRRNEPRDHDSIGMWVRHRFGDRVHDRLVDALVGSIYAADCDKFSLAAVPQLAELAAAGRSAVLSGRRRRTASTPTGPIFGAPSDGMHDLVIRTVDHAVAAGATVQLSTPVASVEPHGEGWTVNGEHADGVIIATQARHAATLLGGVAPEASRLLSTVETADVIMVTVALPAGSLPRSAQGRSGYLVPKSVQQRVTAVSFASQKWAHWRPDDGREVLRISLGRDGAPIDDLTDEHAVAVAMAEVGVHLGITATPTDVRVTRWVDAFPQYRPHHHRLVDAVLANCPGGIAVAGASYHGIGIPACVADGTRAARDILSHCGITPVA